MLWGMAVNHLSQVPLLVLATLCCPVHRDSGFRSTWQKWNYSPQGCNWYSGVVGTCGAKQQWCHLNIVKLVKKQSWIVKQFLAWPQWKRKLCQWQLRDTVFCMFIWVDLPLSSWREENFSCLGLCFTTFHIVKIGCVSQEKVKYYFCW